MIARVAVLLCVATVGTPAWAQSPAPAGEAEFPYTGELTGINVFVRSRPDIGPEYRCTQLSKPTKVSVLGKQGKWLKIVPPSGCFSAISKQYVRPDETGEVGSVTGDNVRVRAGGTLRKGRFVTIQTRLNKGDRVRIIGEVGEYYKIIPPRGVYFWIHGNYVKGSSIPEPPPPREITPEPTAPPAAPVVIEPVPPETPEEFAAALEAFKEAEKALDKEYEKPLARRDLKSVLDKYQAIKVKESSGLKPRVEARILFLQNAVKRLKELKAIEDLIRKTKDKQKEFELARIRAELESAAEGVPGLFIAQGVLTSSDVFRGSPATPRRFILRDPDGRITSYVRSATAEVDLSKHVGKLIGVVGSRRYDKNLEVDVIQAREIQVLAEDVKLPTPPAPIVKRLPLKPVVEGPPEPLPTKEPVEKPPLKEAPTKEPPPTPVEKPSKEPIPVPRPVTEKTPEPKVRPIRPIMVPRETEPETQPTEAPPPAPETQPTKPPPEPESKPSEASTPETKPEAETQPTAPLPPTGLDEVKPSVIQEEPIDEEEYQ